MIRLGIAPRLIDFATDARSIVDSWFNQVTTRFGVVWKAGATVLSEVPTDQWGFFKNTSTGVVDLIVNDSGTLKSVHVTSTPDSPTFTSITTGKLVATLDPVVMCLSGAATSLTASTSTKVLFSNVIYDPNSAFSTGTSRFQPTVAGYYLIHADISMDMSTGPGISAFISSIWKNGSVWSTHEIVLPAVGANYNCSTTTVVQLNGTTDFIEVFGFQNTGVARNTNTGTSGSSLCCALLRAT